MPTHYTHNLLLNHERASEFRLSTEAAAYPEKGCGTHSARVCAAAAFGVPATPIMLCRPDRATGWDGSVSRSRPVYLLH